MRLMWSALCVGITVCGTVVTIGVEAGRIAEVQMWQTHELVLHSRLRATRFSFAHYRLNRWLREEETEGSASSDSFCGISGTVQISKIIGWCDDWLMYRIRKKFRLHFFLSSLQFWRYLRDTLEYFQLVLEKKYPLFKLAFGAQIRLSYSFWRKSYHCEKWQL